MIAGSALDRGREAVARKAWDDAYRHLLAADNETELDVDDLERLALAAFMQGEDYECARAWTRAHHLCIRRNELPRAARYAFWQAMGLGVKGQLAPSRGWVERGRRVLEDYGEDCAERAWLLVLTALPKMFAGDAVSALPDFIAACEIAERFGDREATMFSRLGRGSTLVMLRRLDEGLALLDEVMVSAISGEVSPIAAGIAYCQVIGMCQEIFDLRRAREWTNAFCRWCDSQPGLVAYQGNCLISQCEVLQLQGAWTEAMEAAKRACGLLTGAVSWDTLGSAYYQLGEIQRLRGEFASAEESYRLASQSGRDPEPGMSLLRLAQGRVDPAVATISRVVGEVRTPADRCRLLPAYVEILLAAGDVATARSASDELCAISDSIDAPFLRAVAAKAAGAVLLAEGDPRSALGVLRDAWRRWQEMEAPYEAARLRVLLASALEALGDHDGALRELEGARSAFQKLGAEMVLGRTGSLRRTTGSAPCRLTAREAEVLALLASGKTNRQISSALVISEHTVARHLQNIFGKIGVSSRTAAIAFAFENDLTYHAQTGQK